MSRPEAKIISSKIEFGAFKPEPPPLPLPDDWSEVLRGATVMACAMVPAGPDGDEYNEELQKERQRISNGILKLKGEQYFTFDLPAASSEEIVKLMPLYLRWKDEVEEIPYGREGYDNDPYDDSHAYDYDPEGSSYPNRFPY